MTREPPKLYGSDRPTLSGSGRRVTSSGKSKKSKKLTRKKKSWLSGLSWGRGEKGETKTTRKRSNTQFSLRKTILKAFCMLAIWMTCFVGLAVLWFSYDLPDIHQLQASARKPGVTIQAQDGTVIGTYGDLYEDMVRAKDLPLHVSQAFVAIEDRRFYSHFGVDLIGLVRAAYTNYRAERVVQGGSTLTQQLAKNFLFTQGLYEINDRSLRRKIQEAILAIWLELTFTKDQIITIYLNRVYFGAGTYGIDAASRKYFGKSARNLTVFESAVIAGLLKAPSKYSPARYPERAKARAKIVLDQMVDAGYIKSAEEHLNQAAAESIGGAENGARFFADWIYDSIPSYLGAYDQDLVVITTLNLPMQKHAEEAVSQNLKEHGKKLGTSEMSLVAMTPQGAVRAMVGGKDYSASQFNRVTQAQRQPGSAFKPFVYLTALESGLTPQSRVSDAPISIAGWAPKNFRKITTRWQNGETWSLMEALTKSVNTVTVRLAVRVGGRKIAAVARRLGITSHMITDLSIALGTPEVTLLELTAAFATFANQGMSVWPYGIVEIRDKAGNILYQHQDVVETPVVAPHHVKQMNQMLASVIKNGTGRAANIGIPVAGKTGSNGDIDAWFVGYNTDIVAGIWTGNDNNKPMQKDSTGGRLPTWTWATFMKAITAETIPTDWNPEEGGDTPESSENVEIVTDEGLTYDQMVTSSPSSSPRSPTAPASVAPPPPAQDFDKLLDQIAEER